MMKRKLINWLFSDTVPERGARKAVSRTMGRFKTDATEDWTEKFAKKGVKAGYSESTLNEAIRKAADVAFRAVDEAKAERLQGEFRQAVEGGKSLLTAKNVALAVAGSYGAYRLAKAVKNKVITPIAHKVQQALTRVRAYSRTTPTFRAFPVRAHWRKNWRKTQESATAFGALMRSDVRAVRKVKRLASRIANPFRRTAPRMG